MICLVCFVYFLCKNVKKGCDDVFSFYYKQLVNSFYKKSRKKSEAPEVKQPDPNEQHLEILEVPPSNANVNVLSTRQVTDNANDQQLNNIQPQANIGLIP